MARINVRSVRSFGRLGLVLLVTFASLSGVALAASTSTTVGNSGATSGLGHSPEVPGQPSARSAAFTQINVVRLITGDRVRVMTRADGSTVSTILDGSPHAGAPVARLQTADGSYLLPRTSNLERSRLDLSLFNVAALAAMGGQRVPIVVKYAPHTSPHQLSGVRLDSTSSRDVRGSRVVRGSYADDSSALRHLDLSGVASIRLAGQLQPQAAVNTHSLTVTVSTPSGDPARNAIVVVGNVDDSATYFDTASTGPSGTVEAEVPEGHYCVMALNFRKLAVESEVNVSADRTVPLDFGEATVKPKVSLRAFKRMDTSLSVARSPDQGFPIELSFSGSRLSMHVQPTNPHVKHGSLKTGVSATLIPAANAASDHPEKLAVTGEVLPGIPADLDLRLHRDDFARVVARSYANGPAGLRQSFIVPSNRTMALFGITDWNVEVPGRRVILFQATDKLWYQQTLFPQSPPNSLNITQLIQSRTYATAGTTYHQDFAQGPVGPGVEHSIRWTRRVVENGKDHLWTFLPLFSGAGSSMSSYVGSKDGEWSLRLDDRVLDRGRHWIALNAVVPPASHTYVLKARSHPHAANWHLSTDVRDVWSFESHHGQTRLPLLAPSYQPPNSMTGKVPPGSISFHLTFRGLDGIDRRIIRPTFSLSTTDGDIWVPAKVMRLTKNTFRVSYVNPPATGSRRFMSMRVTGSDAQGNAVTETAMRVYHLR